MSKQKKADQASSNQGSHQKQVTEIEDQEEQEQSRFVDEYTEQTQLLLPEYKDQAEAKLRDLGFKKRQSFIPTLRQTVLHSEGQSKILEVRLGKYETIITLLELNFAPHPISRPTVGKGNFGRVVLFNSNGKDYAAKIVGLKSDICYTEILKEVFLAKFVSALGIGPSFVPLYGYDILTYKGQAQFVMQLCLENDVYGQKEGCNKKMSENLKSNLSIMHSFSLIHRDIKPENIAWSPLQQKYVFLDFGLSYFIKEPVGKNTLTNFVGTFQYASIDMKKIYFLKTKMAVDLYYNDLHCLLKTLNLKEKSLKTFQEKYFTLPKAQSQNQWAWYYLPLFWFKHSLFNKKYQTAQILIEKYKELGNVFRAVVYQQNTLNPAMNELLEHIQIQKPNQFLLTFEQKVRGLQTNALTNALNSSFTEENLVHYVLKNDSITFQKLIAKEDWAVGIFQYIFERQCRTMRIHIISTSQTEQVIQNFIMGLLKVFSFLKEYVSLKFQIKMNQTTLNIFNLQNQKQK